MRQLYRLLGMLLLPLLLCLPALGSPTAPDVIIPGTKRVTHQFVVMDLDQFPEWEFYISPSQMINWTRIEQGQPFSWYHLMDARIYAVAAGETPVEEEVDNTWLEQQPESGEYGLEVTAPVTSSLHRHLTTLRVLEVTDTEVRMELVQEQYFDEDGDEISSPAVEWLRTPMLLALAGLALLLIVIGPKLRAKKTQA